MSSDTHSGQARTAERTCSFCSSPVEDPLSLQFYPGDGAPTGVPDHGGLNLCGACGREVRDLLAAWDRLGLPPATDDDIAAWYAAAADRCGFCEERLGGAPIGLEVYSAASEGPGHANYALCDDCHAVVGRFLLDERADCTAGR